MGGNQKKHSIRVKLLYSLKFLLAPLIKVSRNLESSFSSLYRQEDTLSNNETSHKRFSELLLCLQFLQNNHNQLKIILIPKRYFGMARFFSPQHQDL